MITHAASRKQYTVLLDRPETDILFLIVRALPNSNIRGLRSASVVAKRTSTGRSATACNRRMESRDKNVLIESLHGLD